MHLLKYISLTAMTLVTTGTLLIAKTEQLRVSCFNIHHDKEHWPARLEYISNEYKVFDVDAICLQEVLQKPELENQATSLNRNLGYEGYTFASVESEGNSKRYGNAIISKHKILQSGYKWLEPQNRYRTLAHAVIDMNGLTVDIFTTHLAVGKDRAADRQQQIEGIIDYIETHRSGDICILTGDFNATPNSPEIQYLARQYTNISEALYPGEIRLTTPVPHGGRKEARCIDYIWYKSFNNAQITPKSIDIVFKDLIPGYEHLLPSDHYGLIAEFNISH